MHVFRLWEESGEPRESPHSTWVTPGIKPWEAGVLPTTPLCCARVISDQYKINISHLLSTAIQQGTAVCAANQQNSIIPTLYYSPVLLISTSYGYYK